MFHSLIHYFFDQGLSLNREKVTEFITSIKYQTLILAPVNYLHLPSAVTASDALFFILKHTKLSDEIIKQKL